MRPMVRVTIHSRFRAGDLGTSGARNPIIPPMEHNLLNGRLCAYDGLEKGSQKPNTTHQPKGAPSVHFGQYLWYREASAPLSRHRKN